MTPKIVFISAVMALAAASIARAEPADIAFGRLIAQRNCGECHATGAGLSANPDAPPFRELYKRYRSDRGLDDLLAEGMLAPAEQTEEGGASRVHPRMPQVTLGDDERAALKAYLRSFEPAR